MHLEPRQKENGRNVTELVKGMRFKFCREMNGCWSWPVYSGRADDMTMRLKGMGSGSNEERREILRLFIREKRQKNGCCWRLHI